MTALPRSAPVLVLLAGALVLGASGGAVAGAMITGAQIKNGTITGADIKNFSIGSKDITPGAKQTFLQPSAVSGYEVVREQVSVAGSTQGSIQVSCPEGKVVVGAGSFWGQTSVAPQTFPNGGSPETTFVAEGLNPIASDNLLVLSVYCVEAG
ncbi:hypothetical protein [Nocardioides psychrotolerans]|uniref:hypothetical protein n=1 Tax=Nocardioides psychrotolerans TaxID=1005945 RepID=UPI0031381799